MARRGWLTIVSVVAMWSCSLEWDALDPRVRVSGSSSASSGGGTASSTSSSSSGVGGGVVCAALTADCDGDPDNGCEADLTDPATCGSCATACAPDVPCGTQLSESFSLTPANWTFNGDAFVNDELGQLVLTVPLDWQSSTAFFNRPIVTDDFVASFELRIRDSEMVPVGAGGGPPMTVISPADGFAFVLQTDGPNALNALGGGSLGVSGLSGFGVEVDTFENDTCDGPAPHVAVVDLTACSNFPTVLSEQSLGSPIIEEDVWHPVVIRFEAGAMSVQFAGQELVSAAAIPGFAPGTAHYYGFGAATGGRNSRQQVRSLRIDFPSPRCL